MALPRTPQPSVGTAEAATPRPEPLWCVVLLDDDDHTYDYVIEMLGALFGYSLEKAFALARLVDTVGRVTVMTGDFDACRLAQDRIHAYGPDPRLARSAGSMSAVIEPLGAPAPG